jgi:HSP20 family protein
MSLLRRNESGTAFDLWRDLDEMRKRFESLFMHGGDLFANADWTPSADISETETEYRVHAALPGVKKEDVKVTFENGALLLRGERKSRKEEKNEKRQRIEILQGTFFRAFPLPSDADAEKISARFNDGVLDVTVAKNGSRKSEARTVTVQ